MKKKTLILSIVFLCVFTLFACSRQIRTYADELTTRAWKIKNPSGIEATLEFKGDRALFIISDPIEKDSVVIEGALAIDDRKFYITSEEYYTTFEFGYQVFKDRAEIIYNNETLVFVPLASDAENLENSTFDETL